jgi:hypothetical protein
MEHIEKYNEGFWDKFKKKKEPTIEPSEKEKKVKKNDIPDEEVFITKINGKEFHELDSDEKSNIPDEIWKTLSPYVKRDCYHCAFLGGYISLWCLNDEASEYRGTKIPGIYNCHFWQPNEKIIEKTKKELKKLDEEV